MSQTNGVWKVIPNTAKTIGFLLWLGIGLLMRFVLLPMDPEMNRWQEWLKDLLCFVAPLFLLFYALLVGYVYGDAKRRGMRHVLWTFIAALMPYAIGAIIYFVIRDPLLDICPGCRTQARPGFAYCPKCGTALKRSCGGCGRPVEADWMNCAHCGRKLGGGAPQGA